MSNVQWDEWRAYWDKAMGLDEPNERRDAGEPCVNCGLLWYNETASRCGHWFCDICLGRGHDEDCPACREARKSTPREKTDGTRP